MCVCLLYGIGSYNFRGWQVLNSSVRKPETQENQWYRSHLSVGSLETQNRWGFSLSPKPGKNWCPSSKAIRQEEFPLTQGWTDFCSSGLWLVGGGLLTLGSEICFTYSVDLNIKLIQKHPQRNTKNNVWPDIWASCGPVSLIWN